MNWHSVVRKPKDTSQAIEFIQRAHSAINTVMKADAQFCEKYKLYHEFYQGLTRLLQTTFFIEMPSIVKQNILAQTVINQGTPTFTTLISQYQPFEAKTQQALTSTKYAKRNNKIQKFIQHVIDSAQLCLKRADIHEDLYMHARETLHAFLCPQVQRTLVLLFHNSKVFRKIIKMLAMRVHDTFLVYTYFKSNAPLQADTMHQIDEIMNL